MAAVLVSSHRDESDAALHTECLGQGINDECTLGQSSMSLIVDALKIRSLHRVGIARMFGTVVGMLVIIARDLKMLSDV